jgi:hypothetical protein
MTSAHAISSHFSDTSHIPRSKSPVIFCCPGRSKELSKSEGLCNISCHIGFLYGEELLVPLPSQSCDTTHCRLSSTLYSMYLKLSRTSRGCSLHPQPKDPLYRGDRDQLKMAIIALRNVMSNLETVRFLSDYCQNKWSKDAQYATWLIFHEI